MQRQDMAYRRHTHSLRPLHPKKQPAPKFAARPKALFPQKKEQPAKARCPARVQAALHKARNSFIMPTRFHHRTAL